MRDQKKLSRRKKGERGNTIIEFGAVMPFWLAVLFGTVAMGTNLSRSIQVVQTSRDLANMYANGTDFSAAGFQNLVTGAGGSISLVQGMDLVNTAASGGNAVIYLTQVRHVYSADNDCAGNCANAGNDVFVNQVVLGDTSLFPSFLGPPAGGDKDNHKNMVSPASDSRNKTNQKKIFASTYTMPGNGAVAFVVEVYMSSPEIAFLGFNGSGNYSRAVF
jgi:Flp pilus assembly protein TadG